MASKLLNVIQSQQIPEASHPRGAEHKVLYNN